MNAAEIEIGHVKRDTRFQMFKALAESQAEPRETSQVRSHAEICPFNVAGRNTRRMRIADDGRGDRRGNLGRCVPLWPFAIRCVRKPLPTARTQRPRRSRSSMAGM